MIDPNGWPANPRANWSQLTRGHGQSTLVSWRPMAYDDLLARETRQTTLALMGDLPRLRREPRPASLLTNGTRALEDPTTTVARPWALRLYYLSMAGERLYADFSGLTENQARRGAATSALNAQCWSESRPKERCRTCTVQGKLLPPKKRAGCVVCGGTGKVEGTPPKALFGYRQVVFPSERSEPVTSVHEEST